MIHIKNKGLRFIEKKKTGGGANAGRKCKNLIRVNSFVESGINASTLKYISMNNISRFPLILNCVNLWSVINKSAVFVDSIVENNYDIVVFCEMWLKENITVIRTAITFDKFSLIDYIVG